MTSKNISEVAQARFLERLEKILPDEASKVLPQLILDAAVECFAHTDPVTDVRKFMQYGEAYTAEKPNIPDPETNYLYFKLIQEELFEYARACGYEALMQLNIVLLQYLDKIDNFMEIPSERPYKYDEWTEAKKITEAFDAVVDLQYVFLNLVNGAGFHEFLDLGHQVVHASNMSKFTDKLEVAEKGVKEYRAKNVDVEIKQSDNGLYVLMNKYGKIMKAPTWVEPNLAALLGYKPEDLEQKYD